MPQNEMTAATIAEIIGITERRVRARVGIEAYLIGHRATGGRMAKVYRADVMTLFGRSIEQPEEAAEREFERRKRSDEGLPRNCSAGQWDAIIKVVRALYLQNAQANLKLACEVGQRVAASKGLAWPIGHVQVYRRLMRKDTGRDHQYLSEFFAQDWEAMRRSLLRKADLAKSITPTVRYQMQSMMESMGVAGPGFGAGRLWVLDARKGDSWTSSGMAYAIYIMCGLTGFPLWIEPIPSESETKADVARALLRCCWAWRMRPTVGIALDNGRAMSSKPIVGLMEHLLPRTAWDIAEKFPDLFHDGEPIIRNLPNIPRAPWKASIERSFKRLKDEHDAPFHAKVYQGGSRAEATQLRLSQQLNLPKDIITQAEYFGGLATYVWGDYIQRERPSTFPLLAQRGITPSIAAAWEYYYEPNSSEMPDTESISYLLYHAMWASDKVGFVRCELGSASSTIEGRLWHLVSTKFGRGIAGRKVAIVPVPDTDEAVVMLVDDDKQNPHYLTTCPNFHVRRTDQLHLRGEAMRVQSELRTDLKAAAESALAEGHQWMMSDPQEIRTIPDGAGWTDAILVSDQHTDDYDAESNQPPPQDYSDADPVPVSSRMQRLLSQIDQ